MTSPRIRQKFEAQRAEGKKVLVAYLTVGFPNLEVSYECALAALDAGADILELGVPFSDPTADGPIIAKASFEAIGQGGSLKAALALQERLRKVRDEPVVLFSYYNPILSYGDAELIAEWARVGGDGLLVVDLPPEEGAVLRREAAAAELSVIPLIAPTTGPLREKKILEAGASGFVYYVSVAGVTGSGVAPLAEAGRHAAAIEKEFGIPAVVGFGIGTPEQARLAAAAGASGVVVGTALIRAIMDSPPGDEARRVREMVRSLRTAL